MHNLRLDIRWAMRMFARQPWSSVAIVCTLALGIGTATAAYAVFNDVLFRPVPGVADAGSLVTVRFSPPDQARTTGSVSRDALPVHNRRRRSGKRVRPGRLRRSRKGRGGWRPSLDHGGVSVPRWRQRVVVTARLRERGQSAARARGSSEPGYRPTCRDWRQSLASAARTLGRGHGTVGRVFGPWDRTCGNPPRPDRWWPVVRARSCGHRGRDRLACHGVRPPHRWCDGPSVRAPPSRVGVARRPSTAAPSHRYPRTERTTIRSRVGRPADCVVDRPPGWRRRSGAVAAESSSCGSRDAARGRHFVQAEPSAAGLQGR